MIANLTFDEPTEEENIWLENTHGEPLGAKDLAIGGLTFRVLAWEYGDGMAEFRGQHRKADRTVLQFSQVRHKSLIEEMFGPDEFWSFLSDAMLKDMQAKQLIPIESRFWPTLTQWAFLRMFTLSYEVLCAMPTVNKVHRPWIKKPQPKAPNQGRKERNRDVYGSNRWKTLSAAFRARAENALCAECKKQGKLTPSKVTDHHIPINKGADPWDESNWVGLCLSCHQQKSANERHGK